MAKANQKARGKRVRIPTTTLEKVRKDIEAENIRAKMLLNASFGRYGHHVPMDGVI